jgi:radical SAM/Cys-rich protein
MTTEENPLYDFAAVLAEHNLEISPISLETLWVNITRSCNQSCRHCHVDASPERTDLMSRATIDRCLALLAENHDINKLDITGGAPELHPDFDYLVIQARRLNKQVTVRHNLTVIADGNRKTGESKAYLPQLFAENRVEVLASLPHYEPEITDRIRGPGVFEKSIRSLRLLNDQGYGGSLDGRLLNIVYNHDGPLYPEDRANLEAKFKQELAARYQITFDRLFTVTNMPINRFRRYLQKTNVYDKYMRQLVAAFSREAAEGVACRRLISVNPEGQIYDCDFNQMLGLPITNGKPLDVYNFTRQALLKRRINFGAHCFGCTAGGGGS